MTDAEKPRNERLAAFVADLAQLRREAGQPSLRTMSHVGHYSHTALSSVLSGTRLPSLELTVAFVRACGGDEAAWRARWQREHDILHRPVAAPVVGPPQRRRAWVLTTAGLVAAVTVGVLFGPWPAMPKAEPKAEPKAAPATAAAAPDGADPQEERCHVDAMNATTVDVGARPRYGSLNLRYSPRCHAAWPQFVSNEHVPTGANIHLETIRPSDGGLTMFDYPFLVKIKVYSVFGNMLQTTKGCVSVAIDIRAADDRRSLAAAVTPCLLLTGPGPRS
jgi:Protein of unknown function (DUF2690)